MKLAPEYVMMITELLKDLKSVRTHQEQRLQLEKIQSYQHDYSEQLTVFSKELLKPQDKALQQVFRTRCLFIERVAVVLSRHRRQSRPI